jgi:IS30 family transposase
MLKEMQTLQDSGDSIRAIAEKFPYSHSTVQRTLRKATIAEAQAQALL